MKSGNLEKDATAYRRSVFTRSELTTLSSRRIWYNVGSSECDLYYRNTLSIRQVVPFDPDRGPGNMIEQLPNTEGIRRLTFVSDLHLFSSRSNASEHHDLIGRAIDQSDLCVWGGDLFDFR